MFVERVADIKLDAWKTETSSTNFGDSRVVNRKYMHDKPLLGEMEAMRSWVREKPKHYCFNGPPATAEWIDSLAAAGQTLVQHHMDFVTKSGIAARGGIAREHNADTEILRLALTVDQLDPCQCMSLEYLIRRMIVCETAVARDPKNPDWTGLDSILSTTITPSGSFELPKFTNWISGVQKDQAQVMRNQRQLNEEAEATKKNRGPKNLAAADP